MATMTQTIEINQPADVVAKHYTDWEKYPDFVPFLKKVTAHDDGRLDCRLSAGGIGFHFISQVTEIGDKVWIWKTTKGTLHHSGKVEIKPLSDNSCLMTMEVAFGIPGFEVMKRITNWLGLADSGLRSSLESFRTYVEVQNAA